MQPRNSSNSNYRVALKVRPIDYQQKMIDFTADSASIRDPTNKSAERQSFNFTTVSNTQDQAFKAVEPMLHKLIEGHNSCLLCYGQTGAGKSYTLFGLDEKFGPLSEDGKSDRRGIVPRAMDFLLQKAQEFDEIREFVITGSLCEVFLDQVRDLGKACSQSGKSSNMSGLLAAYESENLTLYENTNGQIMVKDLTQLTLKTLSDVYELLQSGFQMREKLEQQGHHAFSAKSHCIFTINLVQKDKENENLPFMNATIQFVDLAGSERIAKSLTEGNKFQEAILVNSSLTALGKCLTAIAQMNTKNIPYRESKLTRILQNCLNSQAQVQLLVNINPIEANFEECLSSLQYGEKSRGTQMSKPADDQIGSPGGTFPGQDKLIKKLNDEIAELKSRIDYITKEHRTKISELQTILGIDMDLDKMFTKLNPKELNQFKLQKDAAIKVEQLQLQVTELELKNNKVQLEIEQNKKEEAVRQEKYSCTIIELKEQIRRLKDELSQQKLKHDNDKVEHKEWEQNEIRKTLEKNQKVLESKVSIIMNLPQNIQSKTQDVQKNEDIKRLARMEVEKDYKVQIENLKSEYGKLLKAAQEQYEFYLNQKNDEIDHFIKQFKKYQEKKKSQLKDIKQEVFDLYEIILKSQRVIDKIENGAYSSGIRSFNIPGMDKPIWPNRTKFKSLFKYLDQRSLLATKQMNQNQTESILVDKFKQSTFLENTDLTINVSKLDPNILSAFATKLKEELQQSLSREKELRKRVDALENIQRNVDLVTLLKERDDYKQLYITEQRKVINSRNKESRPISRNESAATILIRPFTQQNSRYRSQMQ